MSLVTQIFKDLQTITRKPTEDLNQGFFNVTLDELVQASEEVPAEEVEEVVADVEAEDRRRRMRLSRRLATMDDIVAELEDQFTPECDSDDEIE